MASELWEKLTARCVDQHRHIERTLEQLLEIKGAMEELSTALDQAESVRETWEPIGDLFIDSLPEHIQSTKVLVALRRIRLWSAGGLGSSQLTPAGSLLGAEGSHLGIDILVLLPPLPCTWMWCCSSSKRSSLP